MYFWFWILMSYLDIKITLDEYWENEMIKYYWCWWTKTEQAWCLFKQGWIKTISLAWASVIWWNLKPIIIEYFWRMKITEPEDKNDREIRNERISEPDLDFLEWKSTEYVNYELAVYSWIFHNNYVDDDYQYLWDIPITWDTHWKLRGYKWDTWYIYNYTFDAWWDINDMFYQTITVTFTSPNSINWESDLMTWYAEWDNVPYFRAPLIKLFAFDRWVQILNGDTRPLFWIRCFSDPLSDSRFREWLVPAYSSWITELTTISNKSVEVPFINHDSTVQFTYGHSTPYLWDFMDQCILELSHTQNNDIQLPFKLSWWFWDSASIIWWNNKQSDSYCKHRDIEIEITNWMKCYIESDNDTNVTEVKLWDIRDIQ